MHKRFLTCCLLFGSFTSAFAQTGLNPPSTAPAAGIRTVSSTDTVQALHNLFSKHRTGGVVWTAIGAAFTVRIITAAASSSSDAGGAVVGTAVFGGVPAAIGIGKLVRFSKATEEQVVTTYEQNKVLPKKIRRRLKKKYFNS